MLIHIRRVINASLRLTGGTKSNSGTGGSDANARDAKESIKRLTHSN